MAEQVQSLAELLPQQAPMREKLRQADVLIADLENMGYSRQASEYRNSLLYQVQLGMQAKSPQELPAIAQNINGIIGGLQTLSKASLSTTPVQEAPYNVLTAEEEAQLGLPAQNIYQRKGPKGKVELLESVRNVPTPEESFRLKRLEAAEGSIMETKKEAESFLNITPELNKLDRLLQGGVQTGKFQSLTMPLKQFASDLGMEVGDIASQEQFKSISGQLALTFGQKLKGSMSDGDRTLLTDIISPSVGTSEQGNKMIIAFYKAGAEKNRMIRDAVRNGLKNNLNPYEIQEKVDEIRDRDIIAEKVLKQFPQLQTQGQQATQPPSIQLLPKAEDALRRARELSGQQR